MDFLGSIPGISGGGGGIAAPVSSAASAGPVSVNSSISFAPKASIPSAISWIALGAGAALLFAMLRKR